MSSVDPVVVVLAYSAAAAVAAALGAVPFAWWRRPPPALIGGAYALASGLMLGAGYLLMREGLASTTSMAVLGAGLGVAYTWASQRYAGLDRLDTEPERPLGAEQGYKTILQNALHAAAEGVAIGVAMVIELRFGIFLALSLLVHNVAEGMALTEVLCRRGLSSAESAGLCVATKVPQPLLAVVAFALSPTFGVWLPLAIGFAAGTLVFLVLTELVPAAYPRASRTLTATLIAAAAAAVVLLEDVFHLPPW